MYTVTDIGNNFDGSFGSLKNTYLESLMFPPWLMLSEISEWFLNKKYIDLNFSVTKSQGLFSSVRKETLSRHIYIDTELLIRQMRVMYLSFNDDTSIDDLTSKISTYQFFKKKIVIELMLHVLVYISLFYAHCEKTT